MRNILIVDDAQTDRELAGKVVIAAGHRPVYATSGKEALQLAKDESPALILLDVVMPNMDGFATCRALKRDAATQNIPVVFVTSKSAESDKFWGQKQGGTDHLAKPFSPETLSSIIRRYVK